MKSNKWNRSMPRLFRESCKSLLMSIHIHNTLRVTALKCKAMDSERKLLCICRCIEKNLKIYSGIQMIFQIHTTPTLQLCRNYVNVDANVAWQYLRHYFICINRYIQGVPDLTNQPLIADSWDHLETKILIPKCWGRCSFGATKD